MESLALERQARQAALSPGLPGNICDPAPTTALQVVSKPGLPSTTRSAVSTPRPSIRSCAFPTWVRREAAREPFSVLWQSFGFVYDGDVLYVRLIGMGKHGHGHGIAPRQMRAIRTKRARFYVRKRRSGGWQVHDRTLHHTGSSMVAKAKTNKGAIALMKALKQKHKAKAKPKTPKRKSRSTDSPSRHGGLLGVKPKKTKSRSTDSPSRRQPRSTG